MFFFFKQKTAYEMRISDWSSDVCSSDLPSPSVQEKYAMRYAGPAGTSEMSAPVSRKVPSGSGDAVRPLIGYWLPVRKSVVLGKRVTVRVGLGGRRIIKKQRQKHRCYELLSTLNTDGHMMETQCAC